MKRTSRSRWTLCALALLLLAGLPQAALACGYACMPLPWDPSCYVCQYAGGSGSCVQTDSCSCYEIQCAVTPAGPEEEIAATSLGFMPVDLQPASSCAEAPVTALVAD